MGTQTRVPNRNRNDQRWRPRGPLKSSAVQVRRRLGPQTRRPRTLEWCVHVRGRSAILALRTDRAPARAGFQAQFLVDEKAAEPGAKLNAQGYLRWEGSTIVMPACGASVPALRQLYDALARNGEVRACCQLLPPSSYHITLRGVWHRKELRSGAAYNARVRANWRALADTQAYLAAENAARGGRDAPLTFHLAPADNSGSLRFTAAKEEPLLRRWEGEVARRLGLRKGAQHWHLTLGYWTVPLELRKDAEAEVRRLVGEFVARNASVLVSGPEVCWYADMTAFHPMAALPLAPRGTAGDDAPAPMDLA